MGTNARDVDVLARAIAAEIRAEQARQNLTLRALASRSGVPHSTLSKSLNEQRVLDVEELGKVCAALGIEPAEIFTRAAAAAQRGRDAVVTPIRSSDVGAVEEDSSHYEEEARAASKKRPARPAETMDDNIP